MIRPVHVLVLVLLLAAALLPRVPLLASASHAFMADEAVDALVVQHLLRGEPALYNWDTTYYGIAEGVLTIPLVWLLGPTAFAFKLGAVLLFLALVVLVFLLGKQVYGPWEGLAAAALLVTFSPQLVRWSTLAAGGYGLLVAWGTLTFCCLHALRGRRSRAGWIALGFLIGFGLYIYELYLVYVAVLAGAAVLSIRRWRAGAAALLVVGFLIGWAPKLYTVVHGAGGGKEPVYALAGKAKILSNVRLLAHACAPAFFGVNPAGSPDLVEYVGSSGALSRVLGAAVLLLWVAAWIRGLVRWRGKGLGTEGLLVLLVPATVLIMLLSRNPQDALSNRYLLPLLTALPVLAGGALAGLARRSRPAALAAVAAALLLILYPAARIAAWHRDHGYMDGPRVVLRREPLDSVLAHLERQGLRGAYAWYWTAYKATFLGGERIVVAPLASWDRWPAYTRQVDRLDRAAYLFRVDWETMDPLQVAGARQNLEDFRNRLASAAVPFEETRIGPYLVYAGPGGRRLLPPGLGEPMPLADPRAEIVAESVPAAAAPGEEVRVPVRITNRSDGLWTAAGLPMAAGSHRVSAAYRWLDPEGKPVVEYGERSLLPGDVRPGETVRMVVRAKAPDAPGTYDLALTLVQENVAWFDQATGTTSRHRIEVR